MWNREVKIYHATLLNESNDILDQLYEKGYANADIEIIINGISKLLFISLIEKCNKEKNNDAE